MAPTASNTAPLNHDVEENSYLVDVKFGSNAQTLTLLVDTGSPLTWVMGIDCIAEACLSGQRFDGLTSTSFKPMANNQLNVSYGSGQISAYSATDFMQIAGFNFTANFGYATNVSNSFLTQSIDGILGLGRNDPSDHDSTTNINTVMDNLVTSGIIKNKEIGLQLARQSDIINNGEITFGGIDPTMYGGPLSWHPAVAPQAQWVIALSGFSINGVSLDFPNRTTILDTGSSFLFAPQKDLAQILSQFPGLDVLKAGDPLESRGYQYALPCTGQPTITFTFDGVNYDVAPADYLDSANPEGQNCGFQIASLGNLGDEDSANQMWVLGDTFLKTVYSVFDFDGGRIGS